MRKGSRLQAPGFALRFPAVIATVAIVVVCATLLAQDQRPLTVRVGTQLAVQTVSVKDREGNPIEGLTIDDFVVTEDGVPQSISLFHFEKLDDAAPAKPLP